MRVAGIIAEYNPFHNGHLYHLRETRRITGCDYVIVVMAGSFTQRGEPAIQDKWERARSALSHGADLVIEMPALFAVRSAQGFAQGGVGILGKLGLVDDLSFGCETTDIHLLARMASLLREEPPMLRQLLREGLEMGMSYPRARGNALKNMLDIKDEVAAGPNTALALEYLQASRRLARPMRPVAIGRSVGYHSPEIGPLASASAIRAALRRGEGVGEALPGTMQGAFAQTEGLDELLLYKLRGMSAQALHALPDMPEGLEGRILRMAHQASSREELIGLVKCKRYTHARISRALTHVLLDMDGELCRKYPAPPYARVLGFKRNARPLMRAIQRVSAIELVTDPARLKGHPCFELEKRATDLWGLCTEDKEYRRAGRDMTRRVVIEE